MGRHYKTTASNAVDYMYELPKELMMGAIAATDAKIDTEITSADEAQKKLDLIKNLKGDNEYVNQQYDNYDSQITSIADEIRNDPMAYKKLGAKMRGVSRSIEESMSRGGLYRAQEHYDKMEAYKKEVNANDEFTSERKKQLIEASEKAYGSMDFQDSNTYNALDPHLIAGYKHIDEEGLINKIGTGWIADQTAWSSARVNADNMIETNRGTREKRLEDDAEAYIRDSMKSSGWYDDKRQGFELDKQLGNIPADTNIDDLMAIEEQRFVDKGRNKLGYQKVTSIDGLSSAGGSGGDPKNKIGPDVRNNAGDKKTRDLVEGTDKSVETFIKTNGGKIGNYGSVEEIVESFSNPTPGKSYEDSKKAFNAAGLFVGRDDLFNQWANAKMREDITYDVVPQEKVNTYNNRDMNTSVDGIYIRTSGGNRSKLNIGSLGELYENNQGNKYLYMPVTGERAVKDTDYKRINGYIVDKDDKFLLDKSGGKITNINDADSMRNGIAKVGGPVIDVTKVPSYTNKGNLQNASRGSFRTITTPTISPNGKISKKTVYVQTEQVLRIDSTTGENKVITLDIEIDPKQMPDSKQ